MVGAYNDTRAHSQETLDLVLRKLHNLLVKVELALFCCGPLNTSSAGSPLATSLAFDTVNATVSQGRCLHTKLIFRLMQVLSSFATMVLPNNRIMLDNLLRPSPI